MSVLEATERSIGAATHLTNMDVGAIEALRVLALKVDEMENAQKFDNVTLPAYLKYCDALGLTPAGRKSLEVKEGGRGKLASVRDVRDRQAPSKKRAETA